MVSSQQIVIGWIEFAIASTILLALTKFFIDRLPQPVDRVNAITLSFIASTLVPLILALSNAPGLQLGLFEIEEQHAVEPPFEDSGSVAAPWHHSQFDVRRRGVEASDLSLLPKNNSTTSPTEFTRSGGSTLPDAASTTSVFSTPQADVWSFAAVILLGSHVLAFAWLALQWITGSVRLRILSRSSQALTGSLLAVWKQVSNGRGTHVRLIITKEVSAPLVFGCWRPVILIPNSVAFGDQSSLRFCLAHEWSHLICRDLVRWQFVNAFQLILWFHPLFWVLRRELQICQDLVADNHAAEQSDDELSRINYSELLMSIAKGARNPKFTGAMGFLNRKGQLARRVNAVLTQEQPLRVRSQKSFVWMSGLLLLVASLLFGSVRVSVVRAQEGASERSAKRQQIGRGGFAISSELGKTNDNPKIVYGQIVDEMGEPVPGARLWLPLQREPRRIVETTADESGKFELRCPTEWISPSIRGSFWTVWAYAPGFAIQSQSVYQVLRGESKQEYAIRLPPESNTRFRIVSPDGQPLAGVHVKPQNYKTSVAWELVPDEMQSAVSGHTDEAGLAILPALSRGPLFRLELISDEFGRQSIRVDDKQQKTEPELRLRPVASLKGRVVTANPEWSRNVDLSFTTDSRNEWKETQGVAETTTDRDGNFQVPIIASGGPLRSYVRIDAALPVRPVLSENVFLTAGETVELEIPLATAPEVYGRVIAKSTGNPVAGAEISLGYGGFRQSDNATTDESGEYRGRALPGGVRVHIISLPDGFVQLGTPWAEPYQVPEDVDRFELPTIEVVGSHLISGQLRNANDRPLPNVRLHAVDGNRRYGFGKSGNEGRFEMSVPDGIDVEFQVFLEDRGSVAVEVVQDAPLILRYGRNLHEEEMEAGRALKPDVTLSGRVLMTDKPVADIKVILKRGIPVDRDGTRYSQVSDTKTDANGNYRLGGLKAGDRYQVEISPAFPAADPRWHHQSPYIQDVPETANGEIELPDVKLIQLTQSIAGVVVDPAGNPVAGATISVQLRSGESLSRYSTSGQPPWIKSDRRGRFQFKGLPDDRLSIMAYFANPKGGRIRFPAKRDVDMNQQDIRIVLDPTLLEEEGR